MYITDMESGEYIATHDWGPVASCPPIRRTTHKWHLFGAQTTPSVCFGLTSVWGKLKSANSSGSNFQKYTPLHGINLPSGIYINIEMEMQCLWVQTIMTIMSVFAQNMLMMTKGFSNPTSHLFIVRYTLFAHCSIPVAYTNFGYTAFICSTSTIASRDMKVSN